jgi:hypothetical protein
LTPFSGPEENRLETETLKLLAVFCCAGLVVSLLCATHGLDLSPGFF